MSLHRDRLRAQHGHPLHRDHTEDLETGIASAVHEIDEMRAALDRVRALHTPQISRSLDAEGNPATYCDACAMGPYPCPTIRVLEGDHR